MSETESGKLLIVAGEASGDQIAALALKELKQNRPGIQVLAVGGDALEAAGAELLAHFRDVAVMGLSDVLAGLPRILSMRSRLLRLLRSGEIRQLVLVDFPGFNLPLACRAHELGIRTVYYISPKYWAWKSGRLKKVAACTDRQALIFPFEQQDYDRVGGRATFVGHPVFDLVENRPGRLEARDTLGLDADRLTLAMFPGSRKGELKRHLPILADVSRMLEEENLDLILQFPSHLNRADWASQLDAFKATRIVEGHFHELISAADLGLVASGTASLECAVLGLPHLVYYKLDGLARLLAEKLVKVKWASPVNLAADRELVPERLNAEARGLPMANWVLSTIRQDTFGELGEELKTQMKELLEGDGASRKVAALIAEEWDQTGVTL